MKRKHNVLIVGAGKIGSIRAEVVKKILSGSSIFIYDTNFRKAQKLAKEVNGVVVRSLKDELQSKAIDLVIVAVVNKYSRKICVSALKNKKHVLCEKPMGINYTEALEICKIAKKYKRKFKCGFNHRYHPAVQEAYKLCRQKEIGEILFIRAIYGHGGRKGYEKEWRAKKSLSGGGELLDQGSHLIDLCHWFFGFEQVKRSYCVAKPLFWKMHVDDNAFVLLETNSGKVAQIHVSWTQWKNKFKFEIYGTKGAIEVDGLGGSYGLETLRVYKRYKLGKPPRVFEKQFKGHDDSWEKEWLDFLKVVDSKNSQAKLMSNQIESLQVMKTISNLYRH